MDLDAQTLIDTVEDDFENWKAKREKTKPRLPALEAAAQMWGVSLETLQWLTLIPAWTVKLAAFCHIDRPGAALPASVDPLLFETQNQALIRQMEQLLRGLQQRGLLNAQFSLVTMPSGLDDGRLHRHMVYQMDDQDRADLMRHMREREGQDGITLQMVRFAEKILQARGTVEMPEDLQTWAQLARRANTPDELVKLVEQAVEQATPVSLLKPPEAPKPKSAPQNRIFATSNLPTPVYDLPPAYLGCLQLDETGRVIREWNAPINVSPFSIGRTLRNSLVLNEARISRNHAYIQWQGDGYYITDTYSSNGTFDAKGEQLERGKSYRLEDGQQLDLGGHNLFRLTFHAAPPESNGLNVSPSAPQSRKFVEQFDPEATLPIVPMPEMSPIGSDERTTQPNLLASMQGKWANPLQVKADDSGETVHLPTLEANLNQALAWVETARKLQENLDPAAHVRLDRASARLQLQFRRWDDLLQLKTFLERPEQIAAFEALLKAPDDQWALHYLGPGGYGKTTLIRYLVTRLAPARELPVARIDFDHLDPRYPRYQPGLLLSALAEELRLQAGQAFTFSGFDQSIASFYEKYPLPETGPGHDENHDWLSDPIFKKVLDDFASALKEMGGKVLLVLDTCEELTKVRLAGQPAENVSITFALLEKLHELEPRLRVIFCGRRPLASAGNGWRYVEKDHKNRKAEEVLVADDFGSPVSRLAARPYLALFPVTGFSPEEGETYLKAAEVEQIFWKPIIQKTMTVPPEIFEYFEWNQSSVFKPTDTRRIRGRKAMRSNPFDVSLYANWVREDPDVTPQMVEQTDLQRYVEMRIVGRARSELSDELLIAVTMLGQFDATLLKATLGSESENASAPGQYGAFDTFDGAFQALGGYEWISHTTGGWLEIQQPILERLRDYYQSQIKASEDSGRLWSRLRTQALAHLEERTMTDARTGGSFAAAEVALLLYAQQNPSDAFEWFSRFNRAITDWNWGQMATERLLGVPLEKDPISQLLQARILVLQGAARLHQYFAADLRQLWQHTTEFVAKAEQAAAKSTPDSYERSKAFGTRLRFVRLMALTGGAAACFRVGENLQEERWNEFWKLAGEINPNLPRETGAILGAIEAAIEARENELLARPLPLEIIEKVYRTLGRDWQWSNSTTQPRLLGAFARSLLGRGMFYEGQAKEGLQHLELAEEACRKLTAHAPGNPVGWLKNRLNLQYSAPNPQLDADWTYLWKAPDDFSARLQLEWGRLARSRLPLRLAETHLPLPPSLELPATLDEDRLIGLELALSEDLRPSPDRRLPELLALMTQPSNYNPYPEVNAHRSLLPARVAAAKALSGVGHFGEAIANLDLIIKSAEERGESFASLPETQVLIELATAARLGPNLVRRYNELLNSTDPESVRLAWPLQALEGRRQPPVTAWKDPVCLPIHAHYRWRGGYALRKEYALALCEVYADMASRARRYDPPRSPVGKLRHAFDLYQLELDDLESQLVLQRIGRLPATATLPTVRPPQFGSEAEDLGLRLNHLLLAQARYQALTLNMAGDEIKIPSDMLDRLGNRYAARLLLQDGELLALRLPRRAVYLLGAARSLFQSNREADPLSAAYAGVCETQALIRAGRHERATVVWHEVGSNYEKFYSIWPNLAQILGLPNWKTIEHVCANLEDKKLILDLIHALNPNWRAWMARLLFTEVALKDDVNEWLSLRRILNSEMYASAEKESGLNLLPAELDGLVEDDTVSDSVPLTDKKGGSRPSWRPSFMPSKDLPRLEISLATTPGTHPLLTDDPISIKLRDMGNGGEAGTSVATLNYRPWRRLQHTEGDPAQQQISERHLPIGWRRALEQKFERLAAKRSRTISVVFQVQDEVSFLPWESLTTKTVAIALQPGVALRRITKNWNQRTLKESAPQLLLACDPSLDELRKLYRPLEEKKLLEGVQRFDLESLTNPENLRRSARPPRVVHLISSATLINETPRLLLSRRRSGYAAQAIKTLTISQPKAAAGANGNGSNTLAGRDLAELLPATRLVILQAQPVEDPNWTPDSATQAAYLRVIAEDIFNAGVPVVLVVPPLILPDTRRFISNLVRHLAEIDWRRDGDNGIVEAVSEARRELARDREQTVRPALDICLYADSSPRANLLSS